MPAVAEKVDFRKTHKAEFAAPKNPALIKVARARYLAIEGRGAPGGELFQTQIGALYGAAWTIKMTKKFAGEGDFKVCALEGLYWDWDKPAGMRWKLLIRVPDFVKQRDLKAAISALKEKGKDAEVDNLKFEKLNEGRCVQMLHVGPYTDECRSIARMQEFAAEQKLKVTGAHHEIYISDPHRVPPERLRTILRLPVK